MDLAYLGILFTLLVGLLASLISLYSTKRGNRRMIAWILLALKSKYYEQLDIDSLINIVSGPGTDRLEKDFGSKLESIKQQSGRQVELLHSALKSSSYEIPDKLSGPCPKCGHAMDLVYPGGDAYPSLTALECPNCDYWEGRRMG